MAVRRRRAGVTLAVGRHPVAAAETLVRRDLAAWRPDGGRAVLVLSSAGRAHLARGEAATPDETFLAQHLVLESREIPGEGRSETVRANAEESPLDWLRRRRDRDGTPFIDPAAFEAGERLRRDLTLGAMLPSVTARWDASAVRCPGAGARDPAAATDAALAARQRATNALAAVGADFADLLIDLCGFLKGLEAIERDRGWPARSAKVVVRFALSAPADHYGLGREARGPDGPRRIAAWRSGEDGSG